MPITTLAQRGRSVELPDSLPSIAEKVERRVPRLYRDCCDDASVSSSTRAGESCTVNADLGSHKMVALRLSAIGRFLPSSGEPHWLAADEPQRDADD